MSSSVQQAFFLLADVSGYTSFIQDNELQHAQEVMGNLLNLIVDELTPATKLIEIEGDAVFVYAPADRFPRGETLVELIEATYGRFRGGLLEMQRATTCACNACRSIPDLDLKFVTSFGEFALQEVAGNRKPVGSTVNLAHRLLKNSVAEKTGWPAYALLTDACLQQLGLESDGFAHGQEEYEHMGSVNTWALDLTARHADLVSARTESVSAETAHMVLQRRLAVPPAEAWAWLNTPELRGKWLAGTTWTRGLRPGGRTGVGAENHCAHGTGSATERIIDWHPFNSYTTETRQGVLRIRQTSTLSAAQTGTDLTIHARLETPLPAPLARALGKVFFRIAGQARAYDTLAQLIAEGSAAKS